MINTREDRTSLEFIRDEIFYDHGYARILLRHYKDKKGNEREWGMTHLNTFGAGAIIAAITKDQEIILERVFRVTLNDWVIELPGGCNDKVNELSETVAKRELLEETGYVVSSTEFLVEIADAPGITDQRTAIYLGRSAEKMHEPLLEDSEIIETILVPLDKLFSYLASTRDICDPKVWAVLSFLYNRRLVGQ